MFVRVYSSQWGNSRGSAGSHIYNDDAFAALGGDVTSERPWVCAQAESKMHDLHIRPGIENLRE